MCVFVFVRVYVCVCVRVWLGGLGNMQQTARPAGIPQELDTIVTTKTLVPHGHTTRCCPLVALFWMHAGSLARPV